MTVEEFIATNETDPKAQELIRSKWQRVDPMAAAVCRIKELVRTTTLGRVTTIVRSQELDKEPPCFVVDLQYKGMEVGSIRVEEHGVMLSANAIGHAWVAKAECGLTSSESDGIVLGFLGKMLQYLYVTDVPAQPWQPSGQSPPRQ